MKVRPALFALLVLTAALIACSPTVPAPDPSRRAWRGPGDQVASAGITTFDRRELAQKVPFPTCIFVGSTAYRYGVVEQQRDSELVPSGYSFTGYALDRWRLLTRVGQVAGQDDVYVSVAGSTGILGKYSRDSGAAGC